MKFKKNKAKVIIIILIVIAAINWRSIGRKIYPIKYFNYIEKYSAEYNFNPYLVASVIKVESNFEKNAVSKREARGLMQLTPSTAKWVAEKMNINNFEIDMLYDEEVNIKMGCWYLNNLRDEFGPNTNVILAAYNGGRGNVKKWLNNKENSKDGVNLDYIPFKETDEYVKKVQVNYNIYKLLYDKDGDHIKSIKKVIANFFSLVY